MDLVFFFFQAEDGIRDLTVTGVQTCALPISISGCRGDDALGAERFEGCRGRGGIAHSWQHGDACGFHRRGKLGESRSDRKSTRLNSSHSQISYAVFCLKKKKKKKKKINIRSK